MLERWERDPALRRGGWITVLAGLLWPLQAALIASAISALAAGQGIVAPCAGFAMLGILRAWLNARAELRLSAAADRLTATETERLITQELRRGPLDAAAPARTASLVARRMALIGPHLIGFPAARLRVGVLIPAYLLCLLPLSWIVPLLLLLTLPLIPLFMAVIGHRAAKLAETQMQGLGDMNALLSERVAALGDIRLLDAGAGVLADFRARAARLHRDAMAVLRVAFLTSGVLDLYAALGVAIAAVFVGFTLLGEIGWGSWGGLTLAQGVFILLIVPEIFTPMRDFSAAWHDRTTARAVMAEIAALPDPAPILGEGICAKPVIGALSARGVILPNGARLPDFTLYPGGTLALTGASGAGKSAALAVLAGLAAPHSGQVSVGGSPLPQVADGWRSGLAFVPQKPVFPAGSLARFLGPGVAQLARAGADEVVARLPGGLAARLGETGAGVSGGEARRLAFARALGRGAGVILADEPTADLDAGTAARIIAALKDEAARGAMVIVASHDPALIAAMTQEVRVDG